MSLFSIIVLSGQHNAILKLDIVLWTLWLIFRCPSSSLMKRDEEVKFGLTYIGRKFTFIIYMGKEFIGPSRKIFLPRDLIWAVDYKDGPDLSYEKKKLLVDDSVLPPPPPGRTPPRLTLTSPTLPRHSHHPVAIAPLGSPAALDLPHPLSHPPCSLAPSTVAPLPRHGPVGARGGGGGRPWMGRGSGVGATMDGAGSTRQGSQGVRQLMG